MKANVLETVCDRCHAEENVPMPQRGIAADRVLLPEGWLHVSGVTTNAVVFAMDLCPECKVTVLSSAGAATRGRAARTAAP